MNNLKLPYSKATKVVCGTVTNMLSLHFLLFGPRPIWDTAYTLAKYHGDNSN